MNLTYRILKNRISSFNRKAHGEQDFYRIAKEQKFQVYDLELECLGCYVADKDGDFIFIDPRIRPPLRYEVEFHELSHALLDFPCDFLYFRQQLHAEVFSLIFLIPKRQLLELLQMPLDEIDYRLQPFIIRRKKIYEIFGM